MFYELLVITGVSVLIGVAAGIVSTSILGTLFKAIDGLPLAPSISLDQLATVATASFLIILGAGLFRWPGCRESLARRGKRLERSPNREDTQLEESDISLALILVITSAAFAVTSSILLSVDNTASGMLGESNNTIVVAQANSRAPSWGHSPSASLESYSRCRASRWSALRSSLRRHSRTSP